MNFINRLGDAVGSATLGVTTGTLDFGCCCLLAPSSCASASVHDP